MRRTRIRSIPLTMELLQRLHKKHDGMVYITWTQKGYVYEGKHIPKEVRKSIQNSLGQGK